MSKFMKNTLGALCCLLLLAWTTVAQAPIF